MSVRTSLNQVEKWFVHPRVHNANELVDFDPLVVVFEPEVGDQFLSSEVSERVLQFHQLDE